MTKLHSHLKKGFICILSLTLIFSNITVYAINDSSNIIIEEDTLLQNDENLISNGEINDSNNEDNEDNEDNVNNVNNEDNEIIDINNDNIIGNINEISNNESFDNENDLLIEKSNIDYDNKVFIDCNNLQEEFSFIQEYRIATYNTILPKTFDINSMKIGDSPTHTCVWETKYDANYHWEQCGICKKTRRKESHSFTTNNGGRKWVNSVHNGYGSYAYREICTCGYTGPYWITIWGDYNTYKNSKFVNTSYTQLSLSNIKQITKSEFESYKNSGVFPTLVGNQTYSWYDDDGDGYGWVFRDGYVPSDGYGNIGTFEKILGSNYSSGVYGDHVTGANKYYIADTEMATVLIRYMSFDSTPTLNEFVNSLPAKSSLDNLDRRYGMKEKFASITSSQWNQLVKFFKQGTYSWVTNHVGDGWRITSPNTFAAGNNIVSSNHICWDETTNRTRSTNNGLGGNCQVCGSSWIGLEDYSSADWPACQLARELQKSSSNSMTCSGHTRVDPNGKVIGTIYCEYVKNGKGCKVRLKCVPAQGCQVMTSNNSNYSSGIQYTAYYDLNVTKTLATSFVRPFSTYFKFTYNGQTYTPCTYVSLYNPYNDLTSPSAYYTNSLSYWGANSSGVIDGISTVLNLKATFSEPSEMSGNLLSLRFYDSDKTTLIKTTNGLTTIPMSLISGSNTNTNGNASIWQVNASLLTEVMQSKIIYAQAYDSLGHLSNMIPITIANVDSIGPNLSIEIDTTGWSKTKTLILKGSDTFNYVYLGIDNDDMQLASTDGSGSRTYIFTGDTKNGKKIRFYGKDKVGNLSYIDYTIDKLDNTKPTINNLTLSNDYSNITVDAIDEGSGIDSYAITLTNVQPNSNEFQSSNVLKVYKSGTYYVWVKDKVGLVSEAKSITINRKESVTLSWNDNNNSNKLRPKNITLTIFRNGSKLKDVELDNTTTSYTFENLDIMDSNGKLYSYSYTFNLNVNERYNVQVDGNTIISTIKPTNFSVTIPKTISLNGKTGKCSYSVKVNGNLYLKDTLIVSPSSSFTLKDKNNISTLQANVTQTTTTFTKDNLGTTSGSIDLNKTKFAGTYNGTFNFNIKLNKSN